MTDSGNEARALAAKWRAYTGGMSNPGRIRIFEEHASELEALAERLDDGALRERALHDTAVHSPAADEYRAEQRKTEAHLDCKISQSAAWAVHVGGFAESGDLNQPLPREAIVWGVTAEDAEAKAVIVRAALASPAPETPEETWPEKMHEHMRQRDQLWTKHLDAVWAEMRGGKHFENPMLAVASRVALDPDAGYVTGHAEPSAEPVEGATS